MNLGCWFCFGWMLSLSALSVYAGETLSYGRDVRPILSDQCFPCHGFDAKKREAGLRLDTPEGGASKTDSGKVAIVPGQPDQSEVWMRILSKDPDEVMPPPDSHKTLSPANKEVIRRWIQEGAKMEKHWAFIPPVKPKVPGEEKNPIDGFVVERLKREGFDLSGQADPATLLRRVTLDLTGLPPTPEELEAFLADSSADAYEKAVDRLLDSPRYGERMATFWLDLSRYGDTNGYLHDIRRTGWPWRDWVIRSFQEDRPFDQFVLEQIAGDLLPGATPEQVLATAFLRNHPITAEGGTIAAEYLNEYAANRVETVGTAFLALTMNCCRCHDHKFDPVSQDEFYSLLAFFNSSTEKHQENNTSPAYPPLIEAASPLMPEAGKVQVMVMQEAPQPVATFLLTRGQYDQPDRNHPVTRKVPKILGQLPEGPMNRLDLAKWMVSPQNPMLARVTMNRLWQQFFGTGIVKSVDDFGLQGEFPSHPDLLDWLACDFRDGPGKAWSVRRMVRQIVTSRTYRQASKIRSDAKEKDPDNRLLAYFPRLRLSAEQLRDQALWVSGLLVMDLGGPPVYPYQPDGLWEERSNEGSNTGKYTRSKGPALYRRSLYTFWKRTSPPPLMSIFDAPDRMACSVKRSVTNTPLQALITLNDEQFLECAKMLAARTLKEVQADDERLKRLYRRVTCRDLKEKDLVALRSALEHWRTRYREAPAEAVQVLQSGETPAPPDLAPEELAAWMLMANTMLNLNETLVRD